MIKPRYEIPSRPQFSQKVIPALYEKVKAAVVHDLAKASAVTLMTDVWTSRAIESYLTVTAHHITPDWNMVCHVLQTRPIYEQHSSRNLAEGLNQAVLERPATTISVTTDDARNIREAGLGPQIGCFVTESALKKNKDITTLSDQDVRTAEEVIEVLKPLKILTTLMSTESSPSVSMILPLKTTVLNSMEPKEEYSHFFHKCTALDPRFKAPSSCG